MSTSDLLRVTRSYAFDAGEAEILIDEYVPLRFRTYRRALGVGYVRLGNYTTSLIEIGVEPRTQIVRGLTVTSISTLSQWPTFNLIERAEGLPMLSTTFAGGEVVDLSCDFELAV